MNTKCNTNDDNDYDNDDDDDDKDKKMFTWKRNECAWMKQLSKMQKHLIPSDSVHFHDKIRI